MEFVDFLMFLFGFAFLMINMIIYFARFDEYRTERGLLKKNLAGEVQCGFMSQEEAQNRLNKFDEAIRNRRKVENKLK